MSLQTTKLPGRRKKSAAGLVSVLLGLGFGIPCAYSIRSLARTGEVWTFAGFPTYGNGPFEQIGLHTSPALLAGFLAVCIAEVAVGILLLAGNPMATKLSYVVPAELATMRVGPPPGQHEAPLPGGRGLGTVERSTQDLLAETTASDTSALEQLAVLLLGHALASLLDD
jgi:hypothetical protein